MYTIVTALIDINRKDWDNIHHKRSFDNYIRHLFNILTLNQNFIIFIDKNYYEKLNTLLSLKNKKNITLISTSFEELYMYKHYEKIKQIMNSDYFKKDLVEADCPESSKPEYNIVVNSKIEFIKKAKEYCKNNNLNYSHYIWIDAGYGHSKIDVPETWNPVNILNDNKINILFLKDVSFLEKYNNMNRDEIFYKFHKEHIDVVNGGVFGIPDYLVEYYYNIYYKMIEYNLKINIIDDDQYFTTICVLEYPELFNIYFSENWYCGFEIFSK